MSAVYRLAAECYALGLDPTDATNDFHIVSIELVDGKPKVEWDPKVNRWMGAEIQAALKRGGEAGGAVGGGSGGGRLAWTLALPVGSRG